MLVRGSLNRAKRGGDKAREVHIFKGVQTRTVISKGGRK